MKNLTFLRGAGGGAAGRKGAPIHKFLSQLLLVNIWKCCFKFQKNHPINEEFDFFEGSKVEMGRSIRIGIGKYRLKFMVLVNLYDTMNSPITIITYNRYVIIFNITKCYLCVLIIYIKYV